MDLSHILSSFLRPRLTSAQGILVALSGGVDSLALFLLLLRLQKQMPFKIHVAHIDHGWRKESADQAEQLRLLAEKHATPFHLKTLDPRESRGNVENFCRLQRLQFFAQLCRQHHLQATLLAHHADDQAETVLKRIFEGAFLSKLRGIQKETMWHELLLWRPFLHVPKQELLRWLTAEGFVAFDDETNRSEYFLRARMRLHLLPFLEKSFGKQITPCLVHLSSSAEELEEFLQDQLAPELEKVQYGPFGFYFKIEKGAKVFAVKYLLRQICTEKNIALPPRQLLNEMMEHLLAGSADKTFSFGDTWFFVDRRHLFCLQRRLPSVPSLPYKINLQQSHDLWGDWKVSITAASSLAQKSQPPCCWRDLWQGCLHVTLPLTSDPMLVAPRTAALYPGNSSIRHHWNRHKVPSLLRPYAPLVQSHGGIIHEFLTGKHLIQEGSPLVHVILSYVGHDQSCEERPFNNHG